MALKGKDQLKPTRTWFCGALFTKCSSLKKTIIVVLVSISLYVLYILDDKYNKSLHYFFLNQNYKGECVIPDPDPFDAEVLKYYWHPEPIKCSSSNHLVYVDSKGLLRFNSSSTIKPENVKCFYSSVKRKEDIEVVFKPEKAVVFPLYIKSDFFRVVCKNNESKTLYDSLLEKIDYESVKQNKDIKKESQDQLSVIIFGIDSMSRLAAERAMPKTMNFIRNELNGYIFKGYNKVGENTFPNLVPLLTGKQSYSNELPKHDFMAEFIDDVGYPFVYYNYSQEGYVTFIAEDWPEISAFNYLMRGFRNPPADHYMRPMYLAMRKASPLLYYKDQALFFLESNKIKFQRESPLCYGSRPKHQILIDYYKKFMTSYRGLQKFSFSWLTEISHEYANFLELADEDVMQFFKWMKEENLLENSVFFFMSDHGFRQDYIVNTQVGRLEYRMPLFSMVLPQHIKKRYPWLHETLLTNTQRLVTPYDVHELFWDILNGNFRRSETPSKDSALPRGISLFKEIPKRRTCADAAISDYFCSCYSYKSVDVNATEVKSIARYVVREINLILKQYVHICAELTLHRVRKAGKTVSGLQRVRAAETFTIKKYFDTSVANEEEKYNILLETFPGGGAFNAAVSRWSNSTISIQGDIGRTNRYGNQSVCLDNKQLRQYCFCK